MVRQRIAALGDVKLLSAPASFALAGGTTRVPVKKHYTGLLSNQGEKSINLYFIMVPLRKTY